MNFFQKIPLAIANALYPYKFYGRENIPKGKAIFSSNHFSIIDCVHYLNLTKESTYFLSKKEVLQKKFVGKLLASYGAIPIDRSNPSIKEMLTALKVLKNDSKLVIFAEGTRNKTGTTELQPLKSGTALFAVKAKCPIVPVMMLNKPRMFRKTKIIIGEPFTFEEFYSKKLEDSDYDEMTKILREKMVSAQEKLKQMLVKKRKKCKS